MKKGFLIRMGSISVSILEIFLRNSFAVTGIVNRNLVLYPSYPVEYSFLLIFSICVFLALPNPCTLLLLEEKNSWRILFAVIGGIVNEKAVIFILPSVTFFSLHLLIYPISRSRNWDGPHVWVTIFNSL